MFFGEPMAALFRKPKNFSDKPKKFSGRQHFKSSLPPSTTLTIFDNSDNFPKGLNNTGGMAPLSPPATAPLNVYIKGSVRGLTKLKYEVKFFVCLIVQ
jgi:hypothetical protein